MASEDEDAPLADLDPGIPGASARARYERLRARDDFRRRRRFGRLAPLVTFLAGPKHSTEVWSLGAEGEEWIGAFLTRAVGEDGLLLHDRRVPQGRANLDHLAIVPAGVWVIDAKHYRGRLERRDVGGCFAPRETLYVGRRDRSSLLASAKRQRALVARHLPPDAAVRAALCFTGVELGLFARPFVLDGVLVTRPTALARTLRKPGAVDDEHRRALAAGLARDFPSYAP
jgi:Nuclease-related domain